MHLLISTSYSTSIATEINNLLDLACANEHCPEKLEHYHLSLMKTMTFTMNLDCLNHRPSVDHVKMSKFLVSHGIQLFIIFCEVELPIRKKYNGGTSLMSAIMAVYD